MPAALLFSCVMLVARCLLVISCIINNGPFEQHCLNSKLTKVQGKGH